MNLMLGPSSSWGGEATEVAALEEKIIQLENRIATLAAARVVYLHQPTTPTSEHITVVRGDDYLADIGRAIDLNGESWPSLEGATVVMSAKSQATGRLVIDHLQGQVVKAQADEDGPAMIRWEFPSELTEAFPAGRQALKFDAQATLAAGQVVTVARGFIDVEIDVSQESGE